MSTRPELIQQRFDDFDDFCETVRGWNLELRRFDRGPFAAELRQMVIGPIQVSRAQFEGRLQQLGTPPPGAWTFGIPEVNSTPFVWRGYEIDPGQVMIFRPGSELDSVSGPGFRVLTCSFPESQLEQVACSLDLPSPSRSLGASEVVRPPTETLNAIRHWARFFFDAFENDPPLIRSSSLHRRLQRELPSRFLEVLASGRGIQPSRPAGSRNQLLDRAVAYIDEHANPPQTVGQIVAAIGANERTLRRAFLDRFGIPPKSYLIAARLDGARRDLRRRAPETPVVDVANRWGFWHMGDFAKRYRQMFGELPSETSRARRPHRKTAPALRI